VARAFVMKKVKGSASTACTQWTPAVNENQPYVVGHHLKEQGTWHTIYVRKKNSSHHRETCVTDRRPLSE